MKTKTILLLSLLCSSASLFSQSKMGSVGLGIDFGGNATLVGPSYKQLFAPKFASQAEILFGGNLTAFSGFYQYTDHFPNAKGLRWYAGIGPTIVLFSGGSAFLLRPMVGLDLKIPEVPLNFSFDWRPSIGLKKDAGGFEPGRFGLGIRYVFN